jgi:hypothetical protein
MARRSETMATHLSAAQARRMRMCGQALSSPQSQGPDAPEQVTRQVCGLQAQDIFAATLGVRARSRDVTLSDVERARFTGRSVMWTWAMRGTLHLVAADDLDWLVAALGPGMIAGAARRRHELGLEEETYAQGLRVVRDHLAGQGPSTRDELGQSLARAGLPSGYSAERYLLHRAACEGVVCLGPDREDTPAFVLLDDWLGRRLETLAPDAALARLARRYLAAYAPATLQDMASWSGLPVSALRPAWDAATADAVEVCVADARAWAPPESLDAIAGPEPGNSPVHLLPPFDTYLLGHRDRGLILDAAREDSVRRGGMISAVLLVDGYVAGTWRPNRKGKRVDIEVDAFDVLPADIQAGVAREVADIERFLG